MIKVESCGKKMCIDINNRKIRVSRDFGLDILNYVVGNEWLERLNKVVDNEENW